MTSSRTTLLFVEHVAWEPGDDWRSAIEHLAARFAKATPLDADAIHGHGGLPAQLDALNAWAAEAGVDLDRELGRWFDEHLSMHVRPDPAVTRTVRALASEAPLHLASALPPRVAEAIARHAGCWRSATDLHAPLRDADALSSTVVALGRDVRLVAAPATPLPPGVTATTLDAARA